MDCLTPPLEIVPVPAFTDNYIWLIVRGIDVIVVDPGDAAPVERVIAARGLTLRAILLTHHHADHVGGVAALLAGRDPGLPVYGPAREAIPGVTVRLREDDVVVIALPALTLRVVDVPGHTSGHIAYVAESVAGEAPLLFCGDTLFAAGCGRLFEGTADEMHASLQKLAALPPETRVYCAHEYTVANLRFAAAVEPNSDAVARRTAHAQAVRARGEPTLPSTIALERASNPFLREREPAVRAAVAAHAAGSDASPVATFAALRRWKDSF